MSERQSILVADDDALLRAVVEHKLRGAGYDVVLVGDGQAALDSVGALRPSLVVLDAMMPIMDGFEVLRRLKGDPDLCEIPVIMLTALRREGDVVAALNLGAADYLPKPFNPDELVARLTRLTLPLQRQRA